ncbi:ABC transporter ATP-binding protein/permease [Ruminococcaceae bacterium OttesenSCG-928-N02]|nr:ABC transporter ATP-binding protein/permease [Ruminococcaceae bacterium OttesenSCG-928-N02]
MLASFILAICGLAYPALTRNIINIYVPQGATKLMFTWCAALFGVYFLRALLNHFVQYWGHIVGIRMQAEMRKDLFHHMQSLPFTFFDENKTGWLLSRIVNDLNEISEFAHHGPEDFFISFIMLTGSFFILLGINAPLTFIIFLVLPVLVFFAVKIQDRMNAAFARSREAMAVVNAEIENSLSGIRVSKAFANAHQEDKKFAEVTSQFVDARKERTRAIADFDAGIGFGIDMLTFLAVTCAGYFSITGKISIGDFTGFLLYISMFTTPIYRLLGFVEQFQDGMSGFRRFREIMLTAPEADPENPVKLEKVTGQIEFENVSFSYGDDQEILHNINLQIPAGKTVALVGPSGGGKTTLCHLIPRFYSPNEGNIMLDGINIAQLSHETLRKNVGIVQQDVFLFTGTVRDNIAYGRLDASEDEILAAVQRANLSEFIAGLPNGLDTYIGERGVKLSGGQKQRISIARVFLKNPPVLVLDEATAALDNITELAIQKSFDELARGRTTLVVAHRLSTVKNADQIVVLSQNGVEETGTHEQLLAAGGVYKQLYSAQFKQESII